MTKFTKARDQALDALVYNLEWFVTPKKSYHAYLTGYSQMMVDPPRRRNYVTYVRTIATKEIVGALKELL